MSNIAPVSIKLPVTRLPAFLAFYEAAALPVTQASAFFMARHEGTTIVVYKKERQGHVSVVFHGGRALEEAGLWDKGVSIPATVPAEGPGWKIVGAHIGSDEVGTGDFFGPITVVAAYVGPKEMKLVDRYHIGDSKTKTDVQIRAVGPTLVKRIPYSLLIVHPAKYNELVAQGYNMNRIKAWLHQQALYNLSAKFRHRVPLFIDQFCTPKAFERYVATQKLRLPNLTFETKGESRYPAVAAASMIARYAFLLQIDKLNGLYRTSLPLGAGAKVDVFAQDFIEKHGFEALKAITKNNFANMKRLSAPSLLK